MAFFRIDGMGSEPRKPASRTPAARTPAVAKRKGIAMHNPAFAAEAAIDESDFTRF
jgi:methyl-accepting chemotaxis protein